MNTKSFAKASQTVLILALLALTLGPLGGIPIQRAAAAHQSAPNPPAPPTNLYLPLMVKITHLNFKACLVTDAGGLSDQSFNAGAWMGIQEAVRRLYIRSAYLESHQQSDYPTHINTFISQGCNIIITVGFSMGDATYIAALAHPAQKFSIVDVVYDPVQPNILGQYFASDQAAFLAGYLAAGVSSTGKVGTFGGIQIPPVTTFMDGFALGVAYYNQQHSASVAVVGWNPATQTGQFTGTFSNDTICRTTAQSMVNQNVDILFPVAGGCGLGAAAVALENSGVHFIGVDIDWYFTFPAYQTVTLTSVLKNTDATTYEAIEQAVDGSFTGGALTGDLENGGVGLAPFHDLAGLVSPALAAELETVRAGIIAGTIPTTP